MTLDVRNDLDLERRHLDHSRACLAAMRERAGRIGDVGIDAFASEAIGKLRAKRLEQLFDDGTTPLFFGRVDYAATRERFHIGRRHVLDGRGDPVVVDWRAPIALPFYRATARDPMDVERRRRFGFAHGVITGFEDEFLTRGDELGTASAILADEIERPRIGPMRDIVATIQPDQDEIVRAALADTICVQGAPGTGKTAVGLHRAAYLLYTHRERLRRGGVLVVGPNRAFLAYIGQVLPALGEVDITQVTIDDVPGVAIRGSEPDDVATLKGDPRLAVVLRRAVYAGVREPSESIVVAVGARRHRLGAADLRAMVDELRAGDARGGDVRYGVARARLAVQVAEAIRRRVEEEGGSPSDAAVARLATSAPVRAFVDATWPAVDPATIVWRLLGDPAFLAQCADGVLDAAEQRLLLWESPPRGARSARWTLADAFLVDEAADLVERRPSFAHVVVDEAQDLSAMQCRALGRRCATGSATLLGDVAQGTTAWATDDWRDTLRHLGKPEARVESLTRGYRVPQQVLDLANRLLPVIAPGLAPAESVRRSPGSLDVRSVPPAGLVAAAVDAVRGCLASEGSVGVVATDATAAAVRRALAAAGLEPADPEDLGDARVTVVPARLVKGLEFDHVVVVEPAEIVAAETRGLRRLFVVLTRAVSRLVVVHAEPLPEPLAA